VSSTSEKSACYDSNNNELNTSIVYENGYIDIAVNKNQTCNVYLDLK